MNENARTHRAAFVKKMKSNRPLSAGTRKRMGKRLAAYRKAQHKGLGKQRAARSALRSVPFTKSERRRGYSFKGIKQRYRRNDGEAPAFAGATKIGLGPAPEAEVKTRKMSRKEKRSALRRSGKKRKSRKGRKSSARKSRKTSRRARPKQYQRVGKRKVRVRYGKFRRARMSDPARRGRKRMSYMHRSRKGYRKIPEWAIAGAPSAKAYKRSPEKYEKARARIHKRRASAARRIAARGGAFVPNKSSAARFRRLRAYTDARQKGFGKRKAARAAVRAVPFTESEKARGASFVGITAGERTVAKKRRKSRKGRKRAKSHKRKARRASARKARRGGRKHRKSRKKARKNKRRLRANARKAHRRSHRKTRRNGRKRRRTTRRNRAAHYEDNRGKRKHRRRKARKNGRRRAHRKTRRNGRKYRRNGVAANFKEFLKIGGLALLGFLGHRLATGVSADFIMKRLTKNAAPDSAIVTWSKPIAGAGLGLLGIVGLTFVKGMNANTKAALGTGLMLSWLQSVAVSLFTTLKQPKVVSYLEGYSNSTAYQLRGHRAGYRGIGAERHARSIGPQYVPIGQYQQAAAGLGVRRAAAVGEYFAADSVQGVGNYEKAGPLALLPTYSATGQAPIVEGIRPDEDLDHVMDLAESAAGLGQGFQQAAAGLGRRHPRRRGMRGMGEYFSAKPSDGSFSEFSVPTQDQWIPNGPLWAGEMGANDTPTESEVPAGILQGPGGNGVLSG